MTTKSEMETDAALDKVNVEKLRKVVNDAVMAISSTTSLPASEVLDILENIRVETVGKLREAIETLGSQRQTLSVDKDKLSKAIEKAIESIADATGLDTDEITMIFTKENDASVNNIVLRLRAQSKHDRANLM